MIALVVLFVLSTVWYMCDTTKLLPQICAAVFSVGIITTAVIGMAIKAGV